MNIKITYDSNNILNQNDLNITFNEKIIDNVKILDSIIEFDLDTNHGYHMLKMSVRQPLFIKDLKIDNNSIRELLYLSFLLAPFRISSIVRLTLILKLDPLL